MGPKYVLILDFCVGCLNIIRLTDEELRESENYDDFEDFLITIEGKYGFRLNNCQWMVTEIWTSIAIRMEKRQPPICYSQIKKRN